MLLNLLRLAFLLLTGSKIFVAALDVAGFWTKKDIERIVSTSRRVASGSISNQEIRHSILLLKDLDENFNCNCENIAKGAASADSFYDFYLAHLNSRDCNCKVDFSSERFSDYEGYLESASLKDMAGALLLGQNQQRLSMENLKRGQDNLRNLIMGNGESKLHLENAHIVLETAIALKSEFPNFGGEIQELALQLLPTEQGTAVCDATLLSPLIDLTEKKIKVQLGPIIDALIPLKFSDDVTSLHLAYDSLKKVKSYKSAPLFAMRSSDLVSIGANQIVDISVFDVLGNSIEVDEVEVVGVKMIGKDSVVGQGLKFASKSVDFSSLQLDVGRYSVQLSIGVNGRSSTIKYHGFITAVDPWNISNVLIGVSDSKSSVGKGVVVSSPNSFAGASASAAALEVVHVSFSLTSTKKPHQCFIRYTQVSSGYTTLFPAKKLSDSSDYTSTLSLSENVEYFRYVSGEYIVSILVGDVTQIDGVEWVIGTVDLKFPGVPNTNLPLYARSLLHTSDTTLSVLPEIEHVMRLPAKRASNFMAATFTFLAIVPLIGFIIFNLSLRPNLSYLRSPVSIIFVLCFAGTLVLYSGYWLAVEGLSFYKTIKYLLFSLPFTLALGYYSLQSVIALRESQGK